ncbi:hypothetical protein BDV29DRAFT_2815 [Aspergillus leporis]|jgi:hypothetical protein|uniref:Uncharacterized protein n=1 Tax=Aspergillus leporis TaxID=41062 RepID=A0A5N5XG07_9EURO|nr:hypothetical protein BDV29DRAFT_2815 [Aspergillus leporis]
MQPSENLVHPQSPVVVSIPGNARISITGRTNADFYQKVILKEVEKDEYIFEGTGEGKAMTLAGGAESLSFDSTDKSALRTWTVDFQNSTTGPSGAFRASKVLRPIYKTVYDDKFKVRSMEWEISSEDNEDDDYNDAVIRIVANVD